MKYGKRSIYTTNMQIVSARMPTEHFIRETAQNADMQQNKLLCNQNVLSKEI